MAAAQKVIDPVIELETEASPVNVAEANTSATPVTSPARELQGDLEARLEGEGVVRLSARAVTTIVVTVCALTWVSGFLLYASL